MQVTPCSDTGKEPHSQLARWVLYVVLQLCRIRENGSFFSVKLDSRLSATVSLHHPVSSFYMLALQLLLGSSFTTGMNRTNTTASSRLVFLSSFCAYATVKRQIVKLRIKRGGSSVDLNDPAVKADILKQVRTPLKNPPWHTNTFIQPRQMQSTHKKTCSHLFIYVTITHAFLRLLCILILCLQEESLKSRCIAGTKTKEE